MTSYLLRAALALLCAAPVMTQAAETVPVGHFDGVSLEGGGHVVLKHGAVQSVTLLKGSTQFTRFRIKEGHTLEIDACNENCPSSYDLQIEIVSPQITGVAIEGGGAIETAGAFPAQHEIAAAINGGGAIDVRAISAGSVHAAVNGGGHIVVTATANLMAAVEGGGEISYHGHPQVTQAVNGGGAVQRMD